MSNPNEKSFPVTWDQFHRDSRALAWRLASIGPFDAVVAIARGGLVPAAIVARELNIRTVETVAAKSYDHQNQSGISILKEISQPVFDLAKRGGKILIVERAFGHHPVDGERELLADLLDGQFGNPAVTPPNIGKIVQRVLNGLVAAFDSYIHGPIPFRSAG